jgi:hypothetical protein
MSQLLTDREIAEYWKGKADQYEEALKKIKAHEVYDLNAVQVATDMVRIAEVALRE